MMTWLIQSSDVRSQLARDPSSCATNVASEMGRPHCRPSYSQLCSCEKSCAASFGACQRKEEACASQHLREILAQASACAGKIVKRVECNLVESNPPSPPGRIITPNTQMSPVLVHNLLYLYTRCFLLEAVLCRKNGYAFPAYPSLRSTPLHLELCRIRPRKLSYFADLR